MNEIIEGWVINLDHDVERKNSIMKEFETTQVKLNFFNAIKHKVGWIGCLRSHLEIISIAKSNNLDMVLVIEDDAWIENVQEFNAKFPIIVEYLKKYKNKWNIFHGGPNINKHSTISSVHLKEPLLFEISKCVSTTFVIYNSSVYEHFFKYLNMEENKLKNCHKIDMIIYNKFNCLTTYPSLIWQKEFKSNITGEIRTNLKMIKKSRDKILKRLVKNINFDNLHVKKYLCVMLIIYSEGDEIYKYNKQIWKQYMNSNENILSLFVMYEPELECECKFISEDNMLLIRGEEKLDCENILNKTKIAIRYCNLNYSYDYIVRTNISSFWIFDNLVNFLQSNEKLNCIQGWKLHNKKGECFISGTSIIVPSNLIPLLLTHNEIKYKMDDVEISQHFMSNGIDIINSMDKNKNFMHLFKFSNLNSIKIKLKNIEKKLNNIIYFRVKNRVDRETNDIYVMDKLLDLVYKKKLHHSISII
jgi:GR25 family glycosyltransferase involved in LPS biosynthesis